MSNEPVPKAPVETVAELAKKGGYENIVAEIVKMDEEHSMVAIESTKDYDRCRKGIAAYRDKRVSIDARRKELKAKPLEACRIIEAAAKELTALCVEPEGKLKELKSAHDEEKLEEKRIKDEAKAKRLMDIQDRIAAIRRIPVDALKLKTAAEVLEVRNELEGRKLVPVDFGERFDEAERQVGHTVGELVEILERKREEESAVARMAEQQKAQEAEAKRQKEESDRLDAERKKQDAEAEVRRKEQKAEDDRREADRQAEQKKIDDQRAEVERQDKEVKAEAERQRQDKEKRDRQRVDDINLRIGVFTEIGANEYPTTAAMREAIEGLNRLTMDGFDEHTEAAHTARNRAIEVLAERIKTIEEAQAAQEKADKLAAEREDAVRPDRIKLEKYAEALGTAIGKVDVPEIEDAELRKDVQEKHRHIYQIITSIRLWSL